MALDELQFNYYPKKKTVVFWNTFTGPLTPNIITELENKKVKIVQFGRDFNASIDELPDCVETINLYYRFQQPILKFPTSLLNIRFGNDYPHRINCWTSSIKNVDVANNYHIIEGLPPYIEKLNIQNSYIDCAYSYKYLPYLPINLKFLTIGYVQIYEVDGILPPNLEVFHIGILSVYNMTEKVEDKELPETLKEIYTFRKNDFLTQILVE